MSMKQNVVFASIALSAAVFAAPALASSGGGKRAPDIRALPHRLAHDHAQFARNLGRFNGTFNNDLCYWPGTPYWRLHCQQ